MLEIIRARDTSLLLHSPNHTTSYRDFFMMFLSYMIYLSAPKGLFPPEPEHYRGPKLKVAIIGAGLAGMSTAVELLDQGHEVQLKIGSFPSLHNLILLLLQ